MPGIFWYTHRITWYAIQKPSNTNTNDTIAMSVRTGNTWAIEETYALAAATPVLIELVEDTPGNWPTAQFTN